MSINMDILRDYYIDAYKDSINKEMMKRKPNTKNIHLWRTMIRHIEMSAVDLIV